MSLEQLDALYTEALLRGETFCGHPTQQAAATALYAAWPALRAALLQQANEIKALTK